MNKKLYGLIKFLAYVAVLGAVVFVYRDRFKLGVDRIYEIYLPCQKPTAYSLGSFDNRFGISKEKFLQNILMAEKIWEDSVGKNLFVNTESGDLKINLIYDYRQEATEKLRKLGYAVNNDKKSYDELVAKYNTLSKEYAQKKAALDQQIADFKDEQKSYEAEVESWNKKGGAPKNVYEQLKAEEERLQAEVVNINANQEKLNATVDTINALISVINRVASSLNMAAKQFNNIGANRGQEFEEGVYESSPTSTRINIYEFDDNQKLVQVLAHELGHALGIEHVDDPKAIMYKLNQGTKNKLAPSDLEAVKAKCRLQ